MPTLGKCWSCGVELNAADYGRENHCLKCGKATRVCRNCRWYDIRKADQCQEPMADPVQDKTRANYCGFFEPSDKSPESEESPEVDLRKAAEDLFK